MKKIDFNKDWICRSLGGEKREYQVTLPHDAMIREPRTAESRGAGNIGWYTGGDYEYRKCFYVPEEENGKTFILECEGVYHNAEVYVNGEKAGFRPYGYINFYINIGKYLKYGEENEIRVIARNSDQPNSRWYPGTGIYRPVVLYIGERMYIPVNGVRIRTVSSSPAVVEICVKTSCPGTVDVEIFKDGKTVLSDTGWAEKDEAVFRMEISDAALWSCETPELYTCKVYFGDDIAEENFGIRELKWDRNHGLTINGNRVILKGACIHHDNGLLGACAFPEAEERKIRILKENGYNAVRSAHYPCSKALLNACDRLGMLVMDEYVDVWYIHKTAYDYAGDVMKWYQEDLKDMVEKDYNHPSVIMYSTGNEVSETAQKKGIRLTAEMTRLLHELDGTRPVTCGINIFFNFLSSIGFGVYSDEKAKKTAENTEKGALLKNKPSKKKKTVGSEFYNTLACMLGDRFMKWGATLYPCDLKTRDAFANMDIAGYNYGINRYYHDLKKYPDRLILGTETFCKDAYTFYEAAKENPGIIGDFVWAGWDYIGEVGEGCAEYSDYNFNGERPETQMTGGNGRIDLLGKPRAEAAFTRVAFDLEKGPKIAVWPVYQKENIHITGWQLTKALESWSWRGCAGMDAKIEVYARAHSVEMFLNGICIGKKKIPKKSCRVIFRTVYGDGKLTAVSYDKAGKEIGRQTLCTAEKETILKLLPEAETVKPEGLIFLPIRYTDKQGIWKPMEKHRLTVKVENGSLEGLGSANAYKEGNYTDPVTDTYYGEAMAIVRAGVRGTVKITVSDEENTYITDIPVEKTIYG